MPRNVQGDTGQDGHHGATQDAAFNERKCVLFTYGNIMTSILTNTSSMIALQTLKSVNKDLGTVQEQISSGKKVGSAKDNAATWAISKVMESDASSFKKIAEGLAVAESTVAVARNAAETTTKLLTQMKEKIIQANDPAQTDNRPKIQADIEALKAQIGSVVGAAQFNGVNLVNGSATSSISVLGSLDRTGATVTAGTIAVAGQNLSTAAYSAKSAFLGSTGVSTDGDNAVFTIDKTSGVGTLTLAPQNSVVGPPAVTGASYAAGDSISVSISGRTVSYTFTASDIAATSPEAAAATGLRTKIEALGITGLTVEYDASEPGTLEIKNAGATDLSVSAQFRNAGSGGLSGITGINVTTNATGAVAAVEAALQISINAAAAFGTAQSRIETQADFVGKLVTSLQAGIGSMVDADMEEASARLQALQTQQQLGIQSLAIANQTPAAIMALFR